MFLFGVTGGIGSGKTAVCNFLRQRGVLILEADPLAKELTQSLPEIRDALTTEFGPDVYTADGRLNKAKLSQLVFSDPESRARINAIIHPHVLRWIQNEVQRLEQEEGRSLVGVEAALIYESGMDRMLDAVVVVTAPLEKRLAWIARRESLSREEIRKRMASQMPLQEKVRRADYVVENDATMETLGRRAEAVFRWLLERAAASPRS